ncbi:LytTR family DNA-binding domain-containing protein [Alicyclobacillus pomorum]|uniref:LytTR family DNA-binding domain-containing protein n=1 Tax=Alicyclobacillus pomorum TaxID=204470 RepID=UPI0003F8229D|nr:LytTR family DNA-binding domain-containing protein [Alicyclobacillus pomorum]
MAALPILEQLERVLKDWIPETASIAVADHHQYVYYAPGEYDLRIRPGEPVRPGSVADRVFRERTRVASDVDSSVFGIPYYGMGYPFQSTSGDLSALTVILPPNRRIQQQPLHFVMGQLDNMWLPTPVEDIAYFESYEKKTWLYTEDLALTTNHTLQSLEARLPKGRFLRIHRSYIVNISFIQSIYRDARSNLVVSLKHPSNPHLTVGQSHVRYVREMLGF